MLEATPVRNIDRDQEIVEAPEVRAVPTPAVPATLSRTAAANEATLRRTRRRTIVWDDGGLKPFRLA